MFRLIFRILLIAILIVLFALAAFRVAAALRETETADALIAGNPTFHQAGGAHDEPGSAFVSTASGAMYTLSAGPKNGPPLLLAHGSAAWSGFWATQVLHLSAAGYRATAFDMPPFGFSERDATGNYSRTRQAQRILDLVEALELRPILIAHSFGAAPATEAVLMNPDAFSGLIIIDGALGMTATPVAQPLPLPLRARPVREAALSLSATNPLMTHQLLRGLLHNKDAATKEVVRVLQLPQRRRGTTTAYANWLPSLLAPDPDALSRNPASYADLPVPIQIIWGTRDAVTPPAQAEALASAIGQGPVRYLEDVGHIPHIEAPVAFGALLLKTLDDMLKPR